jgi:hypothetical protein
MTSVGQLAILSSLAAVLAGQQPAQPAGALGTVKALACSFPVYATANLAGTPPQPIGQKQDFSFTLDSFDLKKLRARVVGSSGGSAPASLLASPIGVTVIEQTLIGNVNMTTVFAAGGHDDTRLAVHSRHIGDPDGLPSVSQAYGTCTIQK